MKQSRLARLAGLAAVASLAFLVVGAGVVWAVQSSAPATDPAEVVPTAAAPLARAAQSSAEANVPAGVAQPSVRSLGMADISLDASAQAQIDDPQNKGKVLEMERGVDGKFHVVAIHAGVAGAAIP